MLAVHSTSASGTPPESVDLLDAASSAGAEQGIPLSFGGFENPAWLPDGNRVVVAVKNGSSTDLSLVDRGGQSGGTLAHVDGDVSLDVSPDGTRLAYTSQTGEGDDLSSTLSVIDLSGRPADRAPADCRRGGRDLVAVE